MNSSTQTPTTQALLKEFKTTYGDIGGGNPGIQALLLHQLVKSLSGGTVAPPSGSATSPGTVASTVTIRGSTGQTVLTDSTGAIVVSKAASEDTLMSLLNRVPVLVSGRIPVNVVFPTNQPVTVTNPVTDGAKDSTLSTLLQRVPESTNGRLPVAVQFPQNQSVTIQNQLTGYATEQTLSSLLTRTPALINSRTPVDVQFPVTQHVLLDNPITDHATEATLGELLDRTPELVDGRLPVALQNNSFTISNQIAGFSTEATLTALLDRNPQLLNGRVPVVATFPDVQRVTVENFPAASANDGAKETTLGSVLARLPQLVNGKTPVAVEFPSLTIANQITGFSTEATLSSIRDRLPELATGRVPVAVQFPADQQVTVKNLVTDGAKETTLTSVLARLPQLAAGKTPVSVEFPANQNVTVQNPLTGFSTEATLSSILARTPALTNGKSPVDVTFPTTQRVIVDNPNDLSPLGKETTLAAILTRIPADISRAIAQGFRTEFTSASPLSTALPVPSLGGSPLWGIARTKQFQGLEAFSINYIGRRTTAFNSNGFTDLAEFELQAAGNNLRTPILNGTQTLELISSSANDSANGTGIRTVEVMYLDENFILRSTVITLTGTVATSVAIKPQCVLKLYAASYGTATGAAGNIDIRIPGGGLLGGTPQIVDRISTGETVSLTARACVPDGYVAYVLDVSGSATVANHDFRLAATYAPSDKRLLDGVFNTVELFSANAGTIPVMRTLPYIELPSRCRIRLSSRASANSASATGGFTVIFVKKPV